MNFDRLHTLICEMPEISLKGKQVLADDQPLKGMSVNAVEENIVFIRQTKSGGFIPMGYSLVYFMDSPKSAEAMGNGEIPYKNIPQGTFHSGGSPITDVWKKKFEKPGHEHILGMIEANTGPELIYIDMMSVRPAYKRNSINSLMIDVMRKEFPEARIEYSSATDQGKKFIGNYRPDERP